MKNLNYIGYLNKEKSCCIEFQENKYIYKTSKYKMIFNSDDNSLAVGGEKLKINIPKDCDLLGIKETVLLNFYQIINEKMRSNNKVDIYTRFNPFKNKVYKIKVEMIFMCGDKSVYFVNGESYGYLFLLENDTIIYGRDGFHQEEICLEQKNIELLREEMNTFIDSNMNRPVNMHKNKKKFFCFWGSGYSDAEGNSLLFRPNLLSKLKKSFNEKYMFYSCEKNFVGYEDWLRAGIKYYMGQIEKNLEEDDEIFFLAHSEGCLFAANLCNILPVKKSVFLMPQTTDAIELFEQQSKFQPHLDEVFRTEIASLVNKDIHKIDLKHYKKILGDDLYRVHNLLNIDFEKLYLNIKNPTLIIYGGADFQINDIQYKKAIEYGRINKNLLVNSIPDVGHYLSKIDLGGVGDYSGLKGIDSRLIEQIATFIEE